MTTLDMCSRWGYTSAVQLLIKWYKSGNASPLLHASGGGQHAGALAAALLRVAKGLRASPARRCASTDTRTAAHATSEPHRRCHAVPRHPVVNPDHGVSAYLLTMTVTMANPKLDFLVFQRPSVWPQAGSAGSPAAPVQRPRPGGTRPWRGARALTHLRLVHDRAGSCICGCIRVIPDTAGASSLHARDATALPSRQVRDLGALLPALAAAGEGIGSADADYRRSNNPLPDLQADSVDTVKVLPASSRPAMIRICLHVALCNRVRRCT